MSLSPATAEIEKEMRVWPLNNTDNLLGRGGEPVRLPSSEVSHIRNGGECVSEA